MLQQYNHVTHVVGNSKTKTLLITTGITKGLHVVRHSENMLPLRTAVVIIEPLE